MTLDDRVMAVPLEGGPGFSPGVPQQLFQGRFRRSVLRTHYRPSDDGQRFLTLAPLGRDAIVPATVVLNWTAGLRP